MCRLLSSFCGQKPLSAARVYALAGLTLAALPVFAQPANDLFQNAITISGQWGSVQATNIGATAELGEPSHAGFPAASSIWYKWTAPEDGEVTFDTFGSTDIGATNLDTVVAVYTGTTISQLTQVAANDDYYPFTRVVETTESFPLVFGGNPFDIAYAVPYNGPSIVRFNAKAGTTYYIAVDSKAGQPLSLQGAFNFLSQQSQGLISLNWAFRPSGVFRFATDEIDAYNWLINGFAGMPRPYFQCTETESLVGGGGYGGNETVYDSYYRFDPGGVIVTVTRVGGSAGRMFVDYASQDGTATNGINYSNVVGTLVFDDYEMSKSIVVPIIPSNAIRAGNTNAGGSGFSDLEFYINLSNPRRAPLETTNVSPPRLDTPFARATVRIMSVAGLGSDPDEDWTGNPPTTAPTHDVYNFGKRNYRVPRDITNYWTEISIGVLRTFFRTGTGNDNGATLNYRVNGYFLADAPPQQANNAFALNPGSDYAIPLPSQANGEIYPWQDVTNWNNWDFEMVNGSDGTVSIPQIGYGVIRFRVRNDQLTKFNKDFNITLYRSVNNANVSVGECNECHVTILFDDADPPAGSVDEFYNADYGSQMKPQVATVPSNQAHPGTDGNVWNLAVLPDDSTILVGEFATYNGTTRNCIAKALPGGAIDTTFLPQGNSGANDGIISSLGLLGDGTGRMMIGGTFNHYNGSLHAFMARLNANGLPDLTWHPPQEPDGSIWAMTVLTNNQVLIAGEFLNIGTTRRAHIARLNADGSLDPTFDPGANEPDDIIWSVAVQPDGKILIGGQFLSLGGATLGGLARLNSDGTADTNFNANLNLGVNGTVYSVALQNGSSIVIGGEFTQVGVQQLTRIARLNSDGTIDSTFQSGTGADDTIYNISAQPDGSMYVGGIFTSYNGTHRLGFTRLYADGTVDTTFMDTAYNQFAGLHRRYYDRQAYPGPGPDPNPDPRPFVFASQVLPSGNVVVGGGFKQVGGGQVDQTNRFDGDYPYTTVDRNLLNEAKDRGGVRNRSNFARLIGGSTPGPGNISLLYTNFSINRSQFSFDVDLIRVNGALGYQSANFAALPGLAQAGVDYTYNSQAPVYLGPWWPNELLVFPYLPDVGRSITRCMTDGFLGTNTLPVDIYGHYWFGYTPGRVSLTIKNTGTVGDVNTKIALSNPSGADQFFLGGQNIPLGNALGISQAPLTIVDDSVSSRSGVINFLSATYSANEAGTNIIITIIRTNGTAGFPSVVFSTSDGTAHAGSNYLAVNKRVSFAPGITTLTNIVIPIIDDGVSEPNGLTVNLRLSSPQGATLGLANAVLQIVDNDYAPGYVTFSSANYTNAESSGFAVITVNRSGANKGTVTVQCASTNVTAISGVQYTGFTNTLSWSDGDATPRTINVPLIKDGLVGPNTTFKTFLYNATVNTTNSPTGVLSSSPTVATVKIVDDDAYGNLQFSAPRYLVNENGGYATVTVVRTGGAAQSLTVNYATSDGTAVAHGTLPNYVSTSGSLTFNPGDVAKSFNVPVLDDGVVDLAPNQFYFNVALTSLTPPGATLGFQSNAVVQIVDAETYNHPAGSPDTSFTPTPGFNGDVLSLSLQTNGQIVAAGSFTTADNYPRKGVARYNADSSLDLFFMAGWAGAIGQVNSTLVQADGRLLIGGAFTNFNSLPINRLARLLNDGSLDTSLAFGSGGDNTVFALGEVFVPDRRLLVGGSFLTLNGLPHSGLARLNLDGTADPTFNPSLSINGTVYALAVYPTNTVHGGQIMVGGDFTTVSGQGYNRLMRLNADGTLDTTFNAGAGFDGAVRALAIQADGRVVVGGSFVNAGGAPHSRITRLNTDGSIDGTFNPNATLDDTVNGIVIQPDNRIILVGQFTRANGVSRNRITRFMPDGTTDPNINFGLGADGFINSVALQPDGMIIIGGGFTHFDGLLRPHLARLYGGSITGSGLFSFASSVFFADEDSTNALVTVRRHGGTTGNVSIDFATSDGTDPVTGARAGINYSNVVATLNFPAGETLQSILVPVIDDGRITPDLTNNLTLSNPSPPAGLGDQSTANIAILNDECSVSFSASTYRVNEDTPGDIDVVRGGSMRRAAIVNFMTTTNGTAWPFTNYIPVTNTLTFDPGVSNLTVRVPVLATPGLAEGDKTVSLLLTNANHALLLAPFQSTLTIVDLDQGPGQFMFSQTNYSVGEAAGYAMINVLRTNGHSGVVGVSYATSDGSASSPYKYGATNGLLTFQDGETSKVIAIPINQVGQVTGDQTFFLSLFNPTNGATLLNPTTVAITIIDDNVGLGFSSPIFIATETDGSAVLGISRVGTAGITTVSYATTNGTALAGTNYVAQTGSMTFTNGESFKTIAIPLLHDSRVTGPVTFAVNLFNASAPAQIFTNNPATVTVNDADPGFAFTNANFYTIKSGTNVTISVVRSNANTGIVAVNYATVDDTAVAGVDYSAVSGTLTFSNGIALQSFTVPIINNGQFQGDRDFAVVLANPVNISNPQIPAQLLQPNTAFVTITDDISGLSFSAPSYKVNENGVQATINVLRSGYTNSTVAVNFTTANGTAIGWPSVGFNYYPTNGVFTFTNGETQKAFTVGVNDNNKVDGDKTVLLSLSNPTGKGVLINPSASVMTIVESDGSLIVPAGTAIISESGQKNGAIDPGETVTVLFAFRNSAGTNTANMTATLLATNGVTSPSGTQPYGTLVTHGPVVSRPFTFTAGLTNGQTLAATFQLNDGATSLGTAVFNFIVGQTTTVYSNTAAITIPDPNTPTAVNKYGPAAPYPSVISVAGLAGTVAKATVTVTNFNHNWPSDVDTLLVSPAGQKTYLMTKTGGSITVNNATLTFDDDSPSYVPQSSIITSGTNHPTSYATVAPAFPAPAPPWSAASPYSTNLSVFKGSNPNGNWSLYVFDDTANNLGVISNGWLLTLTTATPLLGNADLGVSMTASPASAIVTSNVTYTITVTNYGPAGATGVVVTNPLPAGAAYVSSSPGIGTVTTNGGVVMWNLGSLTTNGYASLTLVVQPLTSGSLTNSARIGSSTIDLNPDDDSASAVISVIAPTADLALGLSAAPSPILMGGTVTFAMTVTNLGPATATNVAVTNFLPAGVQVISASPIGYFVSGNNLIFTNLGNVGSGGLLLATAVVKPAVGGTLTDSANCSSGIPDPRKLNNNASVKIVVEPVVVSFTHSGNSLVFSWTADAVGYYLESSSSFSPPVVWTPVTSPPPVLSNGVMTVTIPVGTGTEYFRLHGQSP